MLGRQVLVDDLVREVIKDRSYFQKSGGGVTLSGGEPALQADFCSDLMARFHAAGIQTALDTCGMVSHKNLAKILPHTDLLLYDLKEIDPARHTAFTGQSNTIVLENLLFVREYIRERAPEMRLWVRTPLIPGATATQTNLAGISAFLAEHLEDFIERWELCAFNNLCRDKYRRLGKIWEYESTPLLTCDELSQLENWAKQSGFPADRIIATGATQAPYIQDN
jgi:pyruvate formate lyase activating enzyme